MKKSKKIESSIIVLCSYLVIPLFPIEWNNLEFKKITPNKIEVVNSTSNQLKIEVNQSASPILYRFKVPIQLKSLKFEGTILGKLNLANKTQGEEGADDFSVRVGIVYRGNRRLSLFQKMLSAPWLKKVYEMSETENHEDGISHVAFYNIAAQKLKWKTRTHPKLNLIKENIVDLIEEGDFKENIKLEESSEAVGLWLSCDGDDTNSKYDVVFKNISVEVIDGNNKK